MLEVTPEEVFNSRRSFIKTGVYSLASVTALNLPEGALAASSSDTVPIVPGLIPTKESLATSYNNFYEFSLDKKEVSEKVAKWDLKTADWRVEVSGIGVKTQSFSVADLIKLGGGEEERVYRFRCVEAWSMVVPWKGFSLGKMITALNPSKSSKYIKFQTFSDRKIGPNIANLPHYPWPYTEGLTMEEALHPLSFIATGMYNKALPKQNGAPLRLVVPWKYGFKSIKSIVKIEFTDQQPKTLWNELAPKEYGFYANVNPKVDHPRWSQAMERVLDGKFFPTRIPTLLFNGYEKEVAGLYKGLDLVKNY